jgi:hypothetical protein
VQKEELQSPLIPWSLYPQSNNKREEHTTLAVAASRPFSEVRCIYKEDEQGGLVSAWAKIGAASFEYQSHHITKE